MISLIIDPSLSYPDSSTFFSPDEHFPEYKHSHISETKNHVYRAVRDCFAQAGLDREHFNKPTWNPLGDFIRPGSRVFVLCNFVFHRLSKEPAESFAAKCTHGSVLRALIDYLLLAVGNSGDIKFGNAPMQYCRWESVLSETGAQAVAKFYQSIGAPVKPRDLRLFVAHSNNLGGVADVERRSESGGVKVNLATDSLLSGLDNDPAVRYRVMNYNPKRTESFHAQGFHAYVINREILEADVVISLPKFKTHEKVGLTCALKGCVGAVGHKDSLPHHRFGSPKLGGDEYPSDRIGLLHIVSAFHDRVQRTMPDCRRGTILRIFDKGMRRIATFGSPIKEGAWWGNDTAWRMVLDLARILTYATSSGNLKSVVSRKHLVFVDGILGGEGQGPLSPEAVRSGLLLFSDNPVVADYAAALLMGFHPDRIPMLNEALALQRFPLLDHNLASEVVIYNKLTYSVSNLAKLAARPFKTPLGWNGRL